MVNLGVDGYTKTPNQREISKNAKRQPTENQQISKAEI